MIKFVFLHVLLFAVVAILSTDPWPYLMLTIAQLLYVPFALRLIMIPDNWFARNYVYVSIPAYLAIVLLQTTASNWSVLFAAVYLLFTIVIAIYGLLRFLGRGFTNLEEFSIDMGLMYIAMGGGWFFAYIAGIDTGFSPLLTWLTAIHFHYSAFLLPIFIGILGRLQKSKMYAIVCSILLIAPLVVAIGITFSRWIELFSVVLYIIGLTGLILLTWKTHFTNSFQKWLVRISFSALAITITFSLLYALGNGFGSLSVTIDFMLRFHGLLNCVLFAMAGITGWSLTVPTPLFQLKTFPSSQLRGKIKNENMMKQGKHVGLVDDMRVYKLDNISPLIMDFYEQTTKYQLFASVNWHRWFKPFAFLYSLISRRMQQINLPLNSNQIEMTGDILTINEGLDGRENVRAWIRKVEGTTTFVALYSQHETNGRMYMNIALPLPFTTMTGILELNQLNTDLQLSSKRNHAIDSDAGIYLSLWKNRLFKLPLEEEFIVRETEYGTLRAQHRMWIFSIPFLTIDYSIHYSSA